AFQFWRCRTSPFACVLVLGLCFYRRCIGEHSPVQTGPELRRWRTRQFPACPTGRATALRQVRNRESTAKTRAPPCVESISLAGSSNAPSDVMLGKRARRRDCHHKQIRYWKKEKLSIVISRTQQSVGRLAT